MESFETIIMIGHIRTTMRYSYECLTEDIQRMFNDHRKTIVYRNPDFGEERIRQR